MAERIDAGRWSDGFLDAKRQHADPPGDDLIHKIFASAGIAEAERRIETISRLFDTLVAAESPRGSELPGDILHFWTSDPLPRWADRERIKRGQQLFESYGPLIVIILFCSSLPRAYLAAKGVQVLNLTAFLSQDPRRRVIETAQMLVDALTPGGLQQPGAFGISSARKVRVMHAAIRFLIQNRGTWNTAKLGIPINQEDLGGTLCTFSVGVIQGLERIGVTLSETEAEDYLHTWKVIGHILGLDEDMLPRDVRDATALAERIAARHFAVSFEGRYMMNALTELMKELTPYRIFDGLPSSTVRFLIGDEHADLLGVPPADWTRHLIRGLRAGARVFDRWSDGSPAHQRLGQVFGGALLRGLLEMERGPKRVTFRIPVELGRQIGREPARRPGGRVWRFLRGAWRGIRRRVRAWWGPARGG